MRILAGLLFFGLAIGLTGVQAAEEAGNKVIVYIGTYTGGSKSQGIYRMELDPTTGKLSKAVVAGKVANPTFLTIHPTGKYLYAVGEIDNFGKGKKRVGAISAFAIQANGDLKLLNQESSEGAGPCHVSLDKAGKFVFGANYGGGSVCCLPILDGGKVGKATGFVQHKGGSVNKSRQQGPHAHSINLDPTNKFAFAADLGLDKVLCYKVDAEKGTLTPNDPPSVSMKPGAGPRHFAFHPSGKYAYINNELDSTVTVVTYDATTGTMTPIQTLSTLPAPTKGNSTAETVVHPSGKFVYVSNRGHNSIATFTVDETTGKLTATGHQGKGIKIPRNFALDPSGKFCLVANQAGGDVIVFRVNAKTGALEPTEYRAEVPAAVCVRFLKR